MCRPKGYPGENERAVVVARSSIWTSVGVVCFNIFAPMRDFEVCFFIMCYQKGFKCFLVGLFQLPGTASMTKYAQITVGPFENRTLENTTKRRQSIILELPMLRYGHILESFWQAILRKSMNKDVPEKHVFLEKLKMLVREL